MVEVESLKMSIVQPPHLTDVLGAERFRRALSSLLEASIYARLTNSDPWEFAVEAPYLLNRGLSQNDLRLLMRSQVLDHAHEIKRRHQTRRQFRRAQGHSSITEQTCFILSSKGLGAALACMGKPTNERSAVNDRSASQTSLAAKPVPIWNAGCRALTYNGEVVKRFKCRALNQEAVLSAFQEENWPHRIFDPLAPHPAQNAKRRLSDTIKCLNRGQNHRLIRFRGDGTGQGIVWESTS